MSSEMLTPEAIAKIRSEIERLEQLRKECSDGGIRERIEGWIKAEKEKLKSHQMSGLK
jgi:hypothetical protein